MGVPDVCVTILCQSNWTTEYIDKELPVRHRISSINLYFA